MKINRYDVPVHPLEYDTPNMLFGQWCRAIDVSRLEESHAKLLNVLNRVLEWNGIYDTAVASANLSEKHALVDYFLEVGELIRNAVSDAEQIQ